MVIHAWNLVSDTTIKNCVRKCDIINNIYDKVFDDLSKINMDDVEKEMDYKLKLLSLSRFKFDQTSVETFIDLIECSEKSDDLSVSEIYNIVANKSEASVEDSEDLPEISIKENICSLQEAKKSFNELFSFFESKKLFQDSSLLKLFNLI